MQGLQLIIGVTPGNGADTAAEDVEPMWEVPSGCRVAGVARVRQPEEEVITIDDLEAHVPGLDGSHPMRVARSGNILAKGDSAILKKIGEEATETVMAAKDDDKIALVREVADLWFHCLVLLASRDLTPGDVLAELARREGISGLDEKAGRIQP